MKENIKAMIVDFISVRSKIPKKELTADLEVYDSNIISSLSLLELVTLIENQYAIVIEPEDLTEDNFKYIGTIVDYVDGKIHA